jgi:hypothetical protein
MPGGRPTELTAQILEDIRRILPTCLYLETVADFLGVHRTTWRKWLARGAKEAKRLAQNSRAKPRAKEALCLEFFYTYKKALAEGLIFDLGIIKKASQDQEVKNSEGETVGMRQGQWQAAAWRAERRFPSCWGNHRKEIAEIKRQIAQLEAVHVGRHRSPKTAP